MDVKAFTGTPPAHFYKVDIDDARAPKDAFLDWDKPLSQQPALLNTIKKKAKSDPWLREFVKIDLKDDPNITGDLFYDKLRYRFGERQEEATKVLQSMGIPGIRYLDAGSRGKGGTYNTVLFDDSLVKILERE
jgi:hypothetical protein